jgi:hypothetical protein
MANATIAGGRRFTETPYNCEEAVAAPLCRGMPQEHGDRAPWLQLPRSSPPSPQGGRRFPNRRPLSPFFGGREAAAFRLGLKALSVVETAPCEDVAQLHGEVVGRLCQTPILRDGERHLSRAGGVSQKRPTVDRAIHLSLQMLEELFGSAADVLDDLA